MRQLVPGRGVLAGVLAGAATLYPGHGDPAGPGLLAEQRRYLLFYREVVRRLSGGEPRLTAAAQQELETTMRAFLPGAPLTWMIGLGAARGKTPDDIRGSAPSYFLPPNSYRRGAGNRGNRGNGVAEMTAVVSRERAKATCFTGVAGVLMLAVAFAMMVVAAPVHVHHRAPGPAKTSIAQLTTYTCPQLTARSNSTTVRACIFVTKET